jgi:hypothetical protein
MSLDLQKFYRFILPGAILVVSDCLIFLELFGFHINNIKDANFIILFLGMLAIILGVPLYWIYVVVWHFWFKERDRMQSKEFEWLDSCEPPTNDNIYYYSNVIWHYIDTQDKYKQFAEWLRNNFLQIHSLGSSMIALIIGLIIYFCVNRNSFFHEYKSLMWAIWAFLFICLYKYRSELKKRYMKRLEIFIKLNANQILNEVAKCNQRKRKDADSAG